MPKAHAEIDSEYAILRSPLAHKRMVGSEAFVILYPVVGGLAGIVIAEYLIGFIPVAFMWGESLVPTWPTVQGVQVVCPLVGCGIGLDLAGRHHRKKFIAGIKQRGAPESIRVIYTVDDLAFRIATSRSKNSIAWPAILELIPAPDAWLLQSDITTIVLPHHAFANDTDRRTFVGEILVRMSPAARDRSTEAVNYVSGTAPNWNGYPL